MQFEEAEVGQLGWVARIPDAGGHQSRIYVCMTSAVLVAMLVFLVVMNAPTMAYLVLVIAYATVNNAGRYLRRLRR